MSGAVDVYVVDLGADGTGIVVDEGSNTAVVVVAIIGSLAGVALVVAGVYIVLKQENPSPAEVEPLKGRFADRPGGQYAEDLPYDSEAQRRVRDLFSDSI